MSLNKLNDIRNKKYEDCVKWEKFIKLANPNDNGISDPIGKDILEQNNLGFGNGCDWGRKSSKIHKFFKLIFIKKKAEIFSVKVNGFNNGVEKTINNNVPETIRKKFKNHLCIVCGVKHEDDEIDHKIGAKLFMNSKDSRLKDANYYQKSCKGFNNAKRQLCKLCQINKTRPPAPDGYLLPYIKGNIRLNVKDGKKFCYFENPCEGCFYYDPIRFREEYSVLFSQYFNKNNVVRAIEIANRYNLSISDVDKIKKIIKGERK